MSKTHAIKKVLIVYKRSVYQKYVLDEDNEKIKNLINKNHVSTLSLVKSHERNLKSLELLRTTLEKHGIKYKLSSRSLLEDIHDYDLILSLGGDGTFLRTVKHISDGLVMGINSLPNESVGALCTASIENFVDKFRDILSGNFKIKYMPRLSAKLNGELLPYTAVNDILFTNSSPGATSRYILTFKDKNEDHKSSGIWISTPSGSTAAIHAAGGRKMPADDTRFQFCIREPYQDISHPYTLTHGFVEKGEELEIISKMIKSRLYMDGPTSPFTIEYGNELGIFLSDQKLKVIA